MYIVLKYSSQVMIDYDHCLVTSSYLKIWKSWKKGHHYNSYRHLKDNEGIL